MTVHPSVTVQPLLNYPVTDNMDSFFMDDPHQSTDPTADFLAREQAILGSDAALFGNDIAKNGLAAPPPPVEFNGLEATNGNFDTFASTFTPTDDLLGGVGASLTNQNVSSVVAQSPIPASQLGSPGSLSAHSATAPVPAAFTGFSNEFNSAPEPMAPVSVPASEPEAVK